MILSSQFRIVSDPAIFGRGCLLGDAKGSFWIFHFALLMNETSTLSSCLICRLSDLFL